MSKTIKNNLDEVQKAIEAEIFKFISEKIAHYHYKFNEAAHENNLDKALHCKIYSLGWNDISHDIGKLKLFDKMTIESIKEFSDACVKRTVDGTYEKLDNQIADILNKKN